MKIKHLLVGSLFSIGFILGLLLLHAQETAPVQDGSFSLTDTNMDWASPSDAQIELMAIEQVPPIPYEELPDAGLAGTYWSAQHSPVSPVPWPPFPGNIRKLPIWNLGTNLQGNVSYLLDDLGVNYHAVTGGSSGSGGTVQPLDSTSPPSPTDTNTWPPIPVPFP
ncbi:MAG: hypothetical protein KGJ60_00485 [Verrucomicrobiota bacterium]|nr:hypothetical protein [Verrucomicrobiota bacterium]